MNEILFVVLLTLLPTLELRASIPYGILATDLQAWLVVVVATVVNILLAPLLYYLLDTVISWFRKFSWFERLFSRIVQKPQKKIEKSVEKWGELGIALFIGVPLPGSGVYSGAIGAYLLGISKKKFFLASVMGVVIASAAVTAITLSGASVFNWMIKVVH